MSQREADELGVGPAGIGVGYILSVRNRNNCQDEKIFVMRPLKRCKSKG